MPRIAKDWFISLRLSISVLFACFALLAEAALLAASYRGDLDIVKGLLGERLRIVTSMAASTIDPAVLRRLESTDSILPADYDAILAKLRGIKGYDSKISLVYTMARRGPDAVFTADLDPLGSPDNSTGELVAFDNASTRERFFDSLYAKKEAYSKDEFYTDAYGVWLSGFAPVLDPLGEVAGVLGIDISAQEVRLIARRYFLRFLVFGAVLVALTVFLAHAVSSRIARPLRRISEDMLRAGDLALDEELRIPSWIKEVVLMRDSLERMKLGLRSYRKYLPEEVVRELMRRKIEALPGGSLREVTVLFTDIEGFTSITERIEAQRLAGLLAEYFEALAAVIRGSGGTIDKYIGDSVMAFWNAPGEVEGHAEAACRAALGCQEAAAALNGRWKAEGAGIEFRTRIGVATGTVVVGNLGARDRLNYTVVGDTVNLASRLESLNKKYGTSILVAESTYLALGDRLEARLIDRVQVRGRTEESGVYALEPGRIREGS